MDPYEEHPRNCLEVGRMGAGRAALRMLQPYRQPQTRLSLRSPVTTTDHLEYFFRTSTGRSYIIQADD